MAECFTAEGGFSERGSLAQTLTNLNLRLIVSEVLKRTGRHPQGGRELPYIDDGGAHRQF